MNALTIRRPKGQDLVEFALTFPLLILMVYVIFDLGRVVYYYSALQNAVREGARWGIVHPDDVGGVVMIVQDRALGLNPAELTPVEVDYNDTDKTLKVTFSYGFATVTPLIGGWLGFTDESVLLVVVASSTMNFEY
jgi:hypothetical protein